MDAPLYLPAEAFEQPAATSQKPSVETLSLAELMARPDYWAVVEKHLPAVKMIVAAPQLRPQLGNMTLPSFTVFVPFITPQILAAIDEELGHLPAK